MRLFVPLGAILVLLISSCTHAYKKSAQVSYCKSRLPASSSASCTSLLSGSKLEILNLELDSYRTEIKNAHNLKVQNAIPDSYLEKHIKTGNALFLSVKNNFVFRDSMQQVEVSGALRAAAYEADYEGKTFFIKQYSKHSTSEKVLNEVQNAKYLAELGLGPKTHVVRIKNIDFLVMEKLPGINIKDVIHPRSSSHKTQKSIELMLNRKTKSLKEAKKLFALHILRSEPYLNRLLEIQTTLEKHGFNSTFDLQFMIDLNEGPESIKIIDSYFFKRRDPLDPSLPPSLAFNKIIKSLRELTELENN